MKNVTWEEAAEACNNIFKNYQNDKVNNYIQDCCMNALPQGLTQMMATALYVGLPKDHEDVVIMVNAYKQLVENGYVGKIK